MKNECRVIAYFHRIKIPCSSRFTRRSLTSAWAYVVLTQTVLACILMNTPKLEKPKSTFNYNILSVDNLSLQNRMYCKLQIKWRLWSRHDQSNWLLNEWVKIFARSPNFGSVWSSLQIQYGAVHTTDCWTSCIFSGDCIQHSKGLDWNERIRFLRCVRQVSANKESHKFVLPCKIEEQLILTTVSE